MTIAAVPAPVFTTAADLEWGPKTSFAGLRNLRPVAPAQTRKAPAIDFFTNLPSIKEQIDNLRNALPTQPVLSVIDGGAVDADGMPREAATPLAPCPYSA